MMEIWAHRGCSYDYPENSLQSFEKACQIGGLTGIELDIQLTKDGQMVVCHDEQIDRTTLETGYIKDFTLSDLKKIQLISEEKVLYIPTIDEVFEVIFPSLKRGLLLNIELKNSNVYYEGMEEKIVKFVHEKKVTENVIYSSFYAKSLEKMRALDSEAKLGILGYKASDCLYKIKGGCGADAIHLYHDSIDLSKEEMEDYTVRAWFKEPLFPCKTPLEKIDTTDLMKKGVCGIFVGKPEMYLQE